MSTNGRRRFIAGSSLVPSALFVSSSSLVGASPSRGSVGKISVFDFFPQEAINDAFSSEPSLDHTEYLQRAIDSCPEYGVLEAFGGVLRVTRAIIIPAKYITVNFTSLVRAAKSFVGDYLVEIKKYKVKPYFSAPAYVENLRLDCSGVARGLRVYYVDHCSLRNVRIEGALGCAISLERVRESLVEFPVVMNCLPRQSFDVSTAWSVGVEYKLGDVVRVLDSEWVPEASYDSGVFVCYRGRRYFSFAVSVGARPGGSLSWIEVPFEDYRCVVSNTGRDPRSFNSNARSKEDRFWVRVHQDEAAIEVFDVKIDGADRSNQISFVSPIIRDCGNKCYLRIDSSKTSAPATHINVVHGHVHNTFMKQLDIPGVVSSQNQRMVEIGYGVNVNFYGTNVRVTDSRAGVCVLVGDGGNTKRAQNVRLVNCMLSGDAELQRGVVVLPSAKRGGHSKLDCGFFFSSTHSDVADVGSFFKRE